MDSGFVNSLPKLTDDELNQQIQTKQMEVATEPDNVDFAAALELLNTELGKRDTIRNSPLALSINGYNDREIQERISSLQETLTKIKGPISDGGGKLQASIELLEREVEKRKIDKELSVFKNSKEVCDEFNKLFYIDLKERIKNMKSLLAKLPPSDNRGDDLRAAINLAEDIRSTRKKQLQQSRRRSLELEREQRRRQNPPQYAINTHPGRAIPDCRIFTNLKPQVRWTYMNLTAEFKGVVRSMIGEKDAAKLETLKGQAQDVFVKIRKICFGDPELWIDLFEKSESYEILSRVDDSTLKENQDFSFCTVCNKNEMLYNVVVTNCHHPLCLKCFVSACKEMRPCSQCNTTITAEGSRTAHDTKTKHEEVMEILLTKENDKKVVVFSEFSAPLHKLKASLESSNIKAWICIKGKELEGTNSKLIQEFKDSTKGVLLVSLDLLDFLKSQELASAEEWKVIIMSRLPNTVEEKALFVVYESERTEEMVYYVTASDTFEGSFSINDIGAEGKLSGGEGLDDEDRGILKFSAEDCKKLLKGIDHMVGSQPSVSP